MIDRKFRGRQAATGKWIYGSLLRLGADRCYIVPAEGYLPPAETQVYPETVGQWTGQCDRNGKDVYEDDRVIVEGLDGITMTVRIVWRVRGFVQIEEDDSYTYADWCPVVEVIESVWDKYKVPEQRPQKSEL